MLCSIDSSPNNFWRYSLEVSPPTGLQPGTLDSPSRLFMPTHHLKRLMPAVRHSWPSEKYPHEVAALKLPVST
jgi:hypothetical protein